MNRAGTEVLAGWAIAPGSQKPDTQCSFCAANGQGTEATRLLLDGRGQCDACHEAESRRWTNWRIEQLGRPDLCVRCAQRGIQWPAVRTISDGKARYPVCEGHYRDHVARRRKLPKQSPVAEREAEANVSGRSEGPGEGGSSARTTPQKIVPGVAQQQEQRAQV
jgi:hypothetical protein